MGLLDSINNAAEGHEDEVKAGIDKVGDLVDDRTGGQYADKVDQAQDALRSRVGQADQPPADPAPQS